MNSKLAGRSVFYTNFGLLALCSGCLCAHLVTAQDSNQSVEVRPPSPEDSPKSELPVTAFMGAEIRTCSDEGTIINGIVIVQGEKILAVGDATLEVPERAKRFDVTGTIITPGLIDARGLLWLDSPSSDGGASDATLNIVDQIDAFADDWQEVIQHGVTAVYVQPSRRGALSGYGAVLTVAPGDAGPTVLAEQVALQASIGIGASNNRSRQQQIERTAKVLEAAAAYQKQIQDYEEYQKKQKAAEAKSGSKPDAKKPTDAKDSDSKTSDPKSGDSKTPESKGTEGKEEPKKESESKQHETAKVESKTAGDAKSEEKKTNDQKTEEKPPKMPAPDPVKNRLVEVLEGKIPMRLEVQSADDIAFANKMFENEKFAKVQVIYEGLNNPRSLVSSITQTNSPVVLGPWLASEALNDPASHSQAAWGTDFADYDGAVVIASFASTGQGSRMLRAHAAMAISHGFTSDRALKAMTIDAARTLGVADQLGSIAKGKRADLVCFAGEPTDASTVVNRVVSGGDVVYEAKSMSKHEVGQVVEKKQGADTLPATLPAMYSIQSSKCLIDGKLQPGLLTITDGKLTSVIAVDAKGAASAEMTAFDMGDAVILPGLFSAHATLGLNRLIDPQDMPDSSFVTAADCFLANTEARQELIDSGLLRLVLSPGNSNPIAGTASLVRLGAIDPIVERELATKFVLTSQARDLNRFPSSLAGQYRMLQQALGGLLLESRLYLPASVEGNLAARRSVVLKTTADGELFAWIEAQTDAEIRSALDLIEQHKLKAALIGPRQLKPFIERLKKLNVAVVIPPISPTTYNWFSADIAEAAASGVAIMFAGETAEQLRLSAMMSGLPREVALVSLCDPLAKFAGHGAALSPGQPADFVVWTESPVNLAARPLAVVVDGQRATTAQAKSNQFAADKD